MKVTDVGTNELDEDDDQLGKSQTSWYYMIYT